MSKKEDNEIKAMELCYNRGFKYGYIVAKVGFNWYKRTNDKDVKEAEKEADKALEEWMETLMADQKGQNNNEKEN